MIEVFLKKINSENINDNAYEKFKSGLIDRLNVLSRINNTNNMWYLTLSDENDISYLVYKNKGIARLQIENEILNIKSEDNNIPNFDNLFDAIRSSAQKHFLEVYSRIHNNSRLPFRSEFVLEQTNFRENKLYKNFFDKTDFIPRYSMLDIQKVSFDSFEYKLREYKLRPPFYAENKNDNTIHILNYNMLDFLIKKENQSINQEFSYQVASSMTDFATKADLGLLPKSFYENYRRSTKIINNISFDIYNINRKVFIDPYIFDFNRYYDNTNYNLSQNGIHRMDKIRKGETLDTSLKRILNEELTLTNDYVGAKVWGLEFDRDIQGVLTPRLKISIYVKGIYNKARKKDNNWV